MDKDDGRVIDLVLSDSNDVSVDEHKSTRSVAHDQKGKVQNSMRANQKGKFKRGRERRWGP